MIMGNSNFRKKATKKLQTYFGKLLNVKTCNLPNTVYHYTNADALNNIISKNALRFSDIDYLNDESETRYIYELVQNILENKEIEINERFKNAILSRCKYVKGNDYFQRELGISFNEKDFVLSFSKDSDNLILWNNYTKNKDKLGYNIGFDRAILLQSLKTKIDTKDNFIQGNVIYDIVKQKNLIKDVLKCFNNLLEEEDSQESLIFQYVGILLKVYALFYKKQCFENENEYRIVIGLIQDIHGKDCSCDFRNNNGLLIPYRELNFDKNCVKEVGISPTIKESLYNASIRRLLNRYDYDSEIKIFNSAIPLRY